MLLSFAFFPRFLLARDIFLLNKAYSLGIFDYVSSRLGPGVKIKWPNDIYWEDKKVSGILIENQINSSAVIQSILGMDTFSSSFVFRVTKKRPISLTRPSISKSLSIIIMVSSSLTEWLKNNMIADVIFDKIDHCANNAMPITVSIEPM